MVDYCGRALSLCDRHQEVRWAYHAPTEEDGQCELIGVEQARVAQGELCCSEIVATGVHLERTRRNPEAVMTTRITQRYTSVHCTGDTRPECTADMDDKPERSCAEEDSKSWWLEQTVCRKRTLLFRREGSYLGVLYTFDPVDSQHNLSCHNLAQLDISLYELTLLKHEPPHDTW